MNLTAYELLTPAERIDMEFRAALDSPRALMPSPARIVLERDDARRRLIAKGRAVEQARQMKKAIQDSQGSGYPFEVMKALGAIPARVRTDLALTGEPLTAEDVERIGRAK